MRRILCLAALLLVLLVLPAGCASPEDCYAVPQPPEDYRNLMSTIAETKKMLASQNSTTVEDVPPSAGDNTSTVQLLDLDGDGELETAVTFFRVVGAEMPIRIYFYTLQSDESYKVSSVVKGDGASVYAVHYTDLDGHTDERTGKRMKEVVVSWQMGAGVYYLGAYSLSAPEAGTMAMTDYQSYQLLDLDRDGLTELAVCRLDPEQQSGTVDVYSWNQAGLESVSQAPLSQGVTAVRSMKSNYLADMIPALYIAGDLADGSRVTDIVAFQEGALANLSLNLETWVSREQVSVLGYREVASSDVNSDNILELAHPVELPIYGSNSHFWLIDWTQYSISGEQKEVFTTYHNLTDGWYLIIPEAWRSRLTIYRNDSVSGQRTVVFALWQGEDREPEAFLSIYKLTGANRSARAASGNRFVLAEDSSAIYSAAFVDQSGWDCGMDETKLLANFQLIVSSWSGE